MCSPVWHNVRRWPARSRLGVLVARCAARLDGPAALALWRRLARDLGAAFLDGHGAMTPSLATDPAAMGAGDGGPALAAASTGAFSLLDR